MIGDDAPWWLLIVLSGLSSTVVAAVVTALVTWRLGVRGHERDARKNELEAEDRLVGRLMQWLGLVERQRDDLMAANRSLEAQREADAATIRAQAAHIGVLESWVTERKPPPPPERPPGVTPPG